MRAGGRFCQTCPQCLCRVVHSTPTDTAQAVGARVLETLQSQRESIERSREASRGVQENLRGSEGVLQRMGQWWRAW